MGASLSYGILLNLASVCNAEAKETLWGFISRYHPDATPQTGALSSTSWSATRSTTTATM